MGRKAVEVNLHEYSIEDLFKIRATLKNSYAINLISAVIMRCQGISNKYIMKSLGKSKPAVIAYINKWNKKGIKALDSPRGGSVSSFTDEMLDDLKDTVMYKNPTEYGFASCTWTTRMLADYIYDKYKIRYSSEWIRKILIKNRFSHKRGQYKPTKANPLAQVAFKKNKATSPYCRKFI